MTSIRWVCALLVLLSLAANTVAAQQLEFTRFLGGSAPDGGASITVDQHGHIFVTGETFSADFPVANSLQFYGGNGDAYVTKLSSDGATILFSTFLGGSGYDRGHEIVVDADGNIYITGWTASSDFPLRNPVQANYAGNIDAFVAKIDAQGQLVFSTYLGGADFEEAKTLALDPQRNIVVAGRTASTDYPLSDNAVDRQAESIEGFVTKLSADGNRLLFSTYLGGGAGDIVRAIATGKNGQVYVAGETFSSDFPTKHAFTLHRQGSADAFVAAFSPAGGLLFSTYLGGDGLDRAWGVAVNPHGSILVAGETRSADFPVRDAFQPLRAGPQDAFLCRFGAGGALQVSTFLGGRSNDFAFAVAVDSAGYIAVAGRTASPDFPLAKSMGQKYRGAADGFVSFIRADGQRVEFSTFMGGSGLDTPWGVALYGSRIIVGGRTLSPSFPDQFAMNRSAGSSDGFLVSISRNGGKPDAAEP